MKKIKSPRKAFSHIAKIILAVLAPYLIYVGCVKIADEKIQITLDVSKTSIDFEYVGAEASFSVNSNYKWTVSKDASWINVSPLNGLNDGTVTVIAESNPNTTPRSATITVSNGIPEVSAQTINVTQEALPSDLKLSTSTLNFINSGEQKTFSITSNISWSVSSDASSWLTLSQTSGSNNATVTVTATAAASQRTAKITVSGGGITQTIDVTQEGTSFSVSASSMSFISSGEQKSFVISSNTSWTVSSNASSWLTISPTSGSNNGTITVTASSNTSTSEKTAAITVRCNIQGVSEYTITVIQDGSGSPVFSDDIVASNSFGGGNGTQSSPYLINYAQHLKKLVEDVNNGKMNYANTYFKLMTDIQVTASEWIPIGNSISFSGIFDGNYHAIRGTLKSNKFEEFGFFRYLGNGAQITNLTIEANVKNENIANMNSQSSTTTGAIVADSGDNVIINNCHLTGSVTGGNGENGRFGSTETGGIAGFFRGGYIKNCTVSAISTITGADGTQNEIGGIAGRFIYGSIIDCTNNGIIKGGRSTKNPAYQNEISVSITGGIVGSLDFGANITNCRNLGNISGSGIDVSYTGGIAGSISSHQGIVTISNCTNQATVAGGNEGSDTGGIVGDNRGGEILNCTVSASGTVLGGRGNTGGIAGASYYSGSNNYYEFAKIINCTNNAPVSGSNNVGGLVGQNAGEIHTSLNTGNISGNVGESGGLVGYNQYQDYAHVYSCCTNRGNVNNQSANSNNQIGSGKAIESCPDGHTKR